MDCTDCDHLLEAWPDGGLPPTEQEAVEQHVATCGRCRQQARGREAAAGLLQGLHGVDPPSYLRASLGAALAAAQPVPEISCTDCQLALVDHLDATLTGTRREAVDVHLATCLECNQVASDWESQADMAHSLPVVAAPAGLKSAIFARLHSSELEAVRQITCAQAGPLISARLDGETSEELEVHLANCTACMNLALTFEDQRDLLRATPEPATPDDLRDDILERIAAYQQSVLLVLLTAIRRSRHVAWAAGVAVCALVFGGMGLWNGGGGGQDGTIARSSLTAPVVPGDVPPESAAAAAPLATPAVPDEELPTGTSPAVEPARRDDVRPVRLVRTPRTTPRTTTVAMTASVPPAPAPAHTETEDKPATPAPRSTDEAAKPAAVKPADDEPGWDVSPREMEELYAALSASRAVAEPAPAGAPDREAPAAAEPLRTGGSAVTVAFIDESSAMAPAPERFSAPTSTPLTPEPTREDRFEPPPVETRIARDPRTPRERDVVAEIRDRLKKQRRTARDTRPAVREEGLSRTAELKVYEVEF